MIELILFIAIAGFLVWLVTTYVPMAQPFKYAIYVITVLALLFYVWRAFGFRDIPLR
jgi:hypothetical protein